MLTIINGYGETEPLTPEEIEELRTVFRMARERLAGQGRLPKGTWGLNAAGTERREWWEPDVACFCTEGAVYRSIRDFSGILFPQRDSREEDLRLMATALLVEAIDGRPLPFTDNIDYEAEDPEPLHYEDDLETRVTDFNDYDAKTVDDVVAIFDQVLERLAGEGFTA